ncbi:hypothetical protein [Sporolactobacillus spathodeae]|uniref:Uncharacterized protein n=1 Tax=Sporolactobacillus spathodeae TaxID=1465502 RepID=A0ABS2Q9L4_9BACL|nr:hypothetical protein [Sporolactobacillus spathodeae]MBM7658454.1 hypothetical protein [Sporolactobacillus spathodeae]
MTEPVTVDMAIVDCDKEKLLRRVKNYQSEYNASNNCDSKIILKPDPNTIAFDGVTSHSFLLHLEETKRY